jgi:2-dehydro-3-deoxyphosphogluconate aldolase/(4S)-4-hydroxy-2-oxoglutarate aldolase
MSALDDPALDWLSRSRLVPVIVLDDAAHAEQLADALLAGGIDCAEITFRTAAGPGALATLADRNDLLVGAGTVVTPDQVDAAVDSGAKFIVSPGLGLDVVERAQHHGVAVLPGVATASEVQAAASAGLAAVKLFPADQLGGLSMLDALAGPFPTMRFMPSGGITAANAADYLLHPSVFAVGASWTAPRAMIQAGDFEIITQLCRRAIDSLAVPDV